MMLKEINRFSISGQLRLLAKKLDDPNTPVIPDFVFIVKDDSGDEYRHIIAVTDDIFGVAGCLEYCKNQILEGIE